MKLGQAKRAGGECCTIDATEGPFEFEVDRHTQLNVVLEGP